MATTKRARQRAGGASEKTDKVTSEMRKLSVEWVTENAKANEASRLGEKARKALYSQMKAAGISAFDHMFTRTGSKVTIDLEIKTPVSDVIDVDILKKLVDEDTFAKIISATKGKVVEFAGTEVATQCAKPKKGTENVTVKVRK